MKKVFVGLSGGVDSSASAALLKKQGYDVVGVYMKNWTKDLPGMPCPWKEDFQDAKRVAVQLKIPFEVYDFEQQYHDKVVQYMLDGFKAGLTPNPDIMCNQEIKFKLFLDTALDNGADLIATGHYANASDGRLLAAADSNKDQTYFLYRITGQALEKTVFPLGAYKKTKVRQIAADYNLVTADKKESMGICFVGKVGIKDFLKQYVSQQPGAIIDSQGKEIGQHDGALFYTIGQRHGLDVGGGLPYYVIGKDMDKNEVYVTTDLQDDNLWSDTINFTSAHWINGQPGDKQELMVRTRHRAKLIPVKKLNKLSNNSWQAELSEEVRALTAGQSAVFYSGNECLGGGIIS
jgi:tRNA-specific 2-thiouridylase